MSHCPDRRQRRRRPRRQLIVIGLPQLAIALATSYSVTMTSAFAPPPSSPMIFPATTTTSIVTSPLHTRGRNNVKLWAKKKRKKSSSSGEDVISSKNQNNSNHKTNVQDGKSTAEGVPQQTTISGGPSLISEMARRMLVWDDELYDSQILNDAGSREGTETDADASPSFSSSPSSSSDQQQQPKILPPPSSLPPISAAALASASPPRWRPSAIRQQSISNVNPSFRTSSPIMTNAGYAGILRRNSRKKNKPSMWRHCLRIYGKMGELENNNGDDIASNSSGESIPAAEGVDVKRENGGSSTKGYLASLDLAASKNIRSASSSGEKRKNKIKRSSAHHEAALVAASKLGMWEEALLIFRGVEESSVSSISPTVKETSGSASSQSPSILNTRKGKIGVTDNMILSVISACVKGSKVRRTTSPPPVRNDGSNVSNEVDVTNATNPGNTTDSTMTYVPPPPSRPMMREMTVEERRKPLDMALDIILSMEEKHDIPLVSRHVNPLASAYNRLGLCSEAAALINDHLKDRIPSPSQNQSRYPKKPKRKEKRVLTSDNPGFDVVQLVDWSDDDLDGDDEDEDDYSNGYEQMQLNIHQMKSKDRGSYSLLVQGAAKEGDWTGAVQELQRMTEVGLHPNSRNLNSWAEVMERGCRPSGNGKNNSSDVGNYNGGRQRRRSWKKKRDGIWLGDLR